MLDALLDSWQRNNTILINLLRSLPDGGLQARIMETSRTVSEMFMHMHHERMISVAEEAPELKPKVPEQEWQFEANPKVIEQLLNESARYVNTAVKSRIENNQNLELNYSHPMHLIHLLIFHEGYHHGQIKSALKVAGTPISDDIAGPLTWDIWRTKKQIST